MLAVEKFNIEIEPKLKVVNNIELNASGFSFKTQQYNKETLKAMREAKERKNCKETTMEELKTIMELLFF
ncbi:MAG: hypothetical protein Ta2D_00690 [Rickettsiales bacterium]|nr:MAG: hypothetical protein Ta2D_00690 [Rickettsiales bacterium]